MYKCEMSGITIYETLEELLESKFLWIMEYDGNYYIKPPLDDPYDERVYEVNKKTKELSCIHYIDYAIKFEDKAKPVNPETLRRVS